MTDPLKQPHLTQWGLTNVVEILQATFQMGCFEWNIFLKESVLPRSKAKQVSIVSGEELAPNSRHAITWTNDGQFRYAYMFC